jgi:hypothetical protein
MAVGGNSKNNALTEYWNGTTWQVEGAASVGDSTLSAVSCTSSTSCTAVGFLNTGNYGAIAEYWNGSLWTAQTVPDPSGGKAGALYGVSCTSSTSCTAVGQYQNQTGVYELLAEYWNGIDWSIQTVPLPNVGEPGQGAILGGVSCASATSCTAVGGYTNSSGMQVLVAEYWNGTSWTVQTTPSPVGATQSELAGTSCNGASACTAVGEYTNGSGVQVPLAEKWNGTSWTITIR